MLYLYLYPQISHIINKIADDDVFPVQITVVCDVIKKKVSNDFSSA